MFIYSLAVHRRTQCWPCQSMPLNLETTHILEDSKAPRDGGCLAQPKNPGGWRHGYPALLRQRERLVVVLDNGSSHVSKVVK